jgi:hypothetical protein
LDQKNVLIIGGGDGQDYRSFKTDLSGQFWELSSVMLSKAKTNLSQSKLNFNPGHFQSEPGHLFDEVWLHFVLDTMTDAELEPFLLEIKKFLKLNSRIYLADFFVAQTKVQQIIHWIMIRFFRVFTQHSRTDVPNYEEALQNAGFIKLGELRKRKGWIRAQLWGMAVN